MSHFNMNVVNELLRMKKPTPSTLLTAQLFCMLLYVYKNPKCSYFDELSERFDEWGACRHFLKEQAHSILIEIDRMRLRLPV